MWMDKKGGTGVWYHGYAYGKITSEGSLVFMIIGDVRNVDLGTQSFKEIIVDGSLYVDKSRFIEHVLHASSKVLLIARHRRLGKSLNMDMLRCFLTQEEDNRSMFKGLYIEHSSVWGEAHSHPVFYFDFKNLNPANYQIQIRNQVYEHLSRVVDIESLGKYERMIINDYMSSDGQDTTGIHLLTQYVYKTTGKKSYILIDEYDNMLMHNYRSAEYEQLRTYMTDTIEAAVKGNNYLIKAVLTGVMRISKESMFSGLNNVLTYDVFKDSVFTDDYGLTDLEIDELGEYVVAAGLAPLDHVKLAEWYNGYTIGGQPIYNIYSVMSYILQQEYSCYWGQSGTMDMILDLLNDPRRDVLDQLVNNERVSVPLTRQVSLAHLSNEGDDKSFYSLLVQAGYLAVTGYDPTFDEYFVTVPNKELMIVWKDWIFNRLYKNPNAFRSIFQHLDDPERLARIIKNVFTDALSSHDLAVYNKDSAETWERVYHVFLLGLLTSNSQDETSRRILSNRESGDGRYDVLVEKGNYILIFEFKATENGEEQLMKNAAEKAVHQIIEKRYAAGVDDTQKVIAIGVAVYKKRAEVLCEQLR
jgi:hypothetical protein